jgi:imidazolonepropionase-like amidohydrolase
VIDARGGFILPGFIDIHVHIAKQIKDMREPFTTAFALKFHEAVGYMKNTLNTGVTTARDAVFPRRAEDYR